MKTLRFLVTEQTIAKDPSCDFSGLFPGLHEQVKVEFDFSADWANHVKVAGFWSTLGTEFPPKLLENDSCMIPAEALTRPSFKMRVYGKKRGIARKTDLITIYQRGGVR